MATGIIKDPKVSNTWKVIATITDTDPHTLDIPSNYKELLIVIYQNGNGTWRGVQIPIPLENGEPYNNNVYLYSGSYISANSFIGAQIRFNYNGTTATIKFIQLAINGTVYTSGCAMKVYGR